MPIAVITGANRGLGFGLARSYAEDGWRVIALNRSSSEQLDALARDYPLEILLADLTDDRSLADAVARIDTDSVDVLINCAGTMGDKDFSEVGFKYQLFGSFDRAEWLRVFDINVCTPQAVTELLADKLEAADRGCVVTLSSMLGSNAMNSVGNIYAYRASKAAVNSIMRSAGVNLGKRGIIAIALHPGWVQTDMGGPEADISVAESVAAMRRVIDELSPGDGGKFYAWDGSEMPY
jgi:NAD(P)-dependent dehydrogenase (short-subunit alcohol dehydrogenase family)